MVWVHVRVACAETWPPRSWLSLARSRAESAGYWTGRPPLRPVPLEDLVGQFDYATSPSRSRPRYDPHHDLIVIGGGIHGATVALFAARNHMRVALIERDQICRGASGVNAGTLTMQMTRVALIPYALKAHEMWSTARALAGP